MNIQKKGDTSMDYVRVDYDNDLYEYFKNDVDCGNGEMRARQLLRNHWACIRMKRIAKLPQGKRANILYSKKEEKEKT